MMERVTAMLRIALLLVLLLTQSVVAQQLMTLEDAITLGLRSNYDIQIVRNEVEIADNDKGKGLAGFLPSLDVSGGVSRTDSDQDLSHPPISSNTGVDNWNAEATLSWTIFDGFRMFANRGLYNDLAELTEYQARDRIENTVVGIAQAYFNLVLQEQLLQIAIDTRDVSETRLGREKVRNELGGASSTDLFNAQVAFNSDQSALLDQQLQVMIAREQLNILLGQDPSTEFQVSREIAVPELAIEYDQLLDMATQHNAILKSAEAGKRVSDRSVQLARSAFMPRVAAFASYGYSDQTLNSDAGLYAGRDIGTETGSATVGLLLSLNLFNGRRDHIDLQNAKVEATNQQLALRDARNRLTGAVRGAYDTYRKRVAIVELEDQNLAAARQNLELQRERHELGTANSLEFRDAQVSYARAQTSLITARYQARVSHIELERLIGALEIE